MITATYLTRVRSYLALFNTYLPLYYTPPPRHHATITHTNNSITLNIKAILNSNERKVSNPVFAGVARCANTAQTIPHVCYSIRVLRALIIVIFFFRFFSTLLIIFLTQKTSFIVLFFSSKMPNKISYLRLAQ